MMMFGSDASKCAARFRNRSRLSEVTATTVPAGHHSPRQPWVGELIDVPISVQPLRKMQSALDPPRGASSSTATARFESDDIVFVIVSIAILSKAFGCSEIIAR